MKIVEFSDVYKMGLEVMVKIVYNVQVVSTVKVITNIFNFVLDE